jgi:imidazole glycerol phosphate synthase subunit HisF
VASMVHYGDYQVSGLKQYLHEQGLKIRMSW